MKRILEESSALPGQKLPLIDDLRDRTLFKDVPRRTLRELLLRGHVRYAVLQQNMQLGLGSGRLEYVYIIISGYLEVRSASQLLKKGKNLLIAFLGPEQIVGEISAITTGTSEAFFSAVETCELLQIQTKELRRVAEKDFRIYRNLAALLIEKDLQNRRRMEVINMREGEAQIAQTLLNFIEERGMEPGEGNRMRIRGILRQRDLADYIGSDRTTVAKRLRHLKDQRVIDYPSPGRYQTQRIIILNLSMLKRIAIAANKSAEDS